MKDLSTWDLLALAGVFTVKESDRGGRGQKSVSECRPDTYELRPVSKLLPKLHLAHR